MVHRISKFCRPTQGIGILCIFECRFFLSLVRVLTRFFMILLVDEGRDNLMFPVKQLIGRFTKIS